MSLFGRLERASQQAERYRWYALGITTFCQASSSSLPTAIGPLAPALQADLGISRAEIGLMLTGISVSAAVVGLVGGRAADHIGERRVLIFSGVVAGLAGIAIAGVTTYWALLAVCVAIGLGLGIQNPAGSSAVMRWFPPRGRGLAMGIRQTGVPLGGILAATLWPLVALSFGWRAAFVLGGLATLLGAVLIFVAYYDPVRSGRTAMGGPRSLRSLAADPQLLWLSVVYNGQITAQYSTATYFVLFVHEVLGVSVVNAAGLLAFVNVVAIVARISWGTVSDRAFGGRRRPVLVMIVGLTLLSSLVAAATPAEGPVALAFVLAILLGISAFAWAGIMGTLASETVGRESAGTAVALLTVYGSPGTLLGPPAFGWLADQTGTYWVPWLATAATIVIGLFAVARVTERPVRLTGSR